jgi:hypothetical protein
MLCIIADACACIGDGVLAVTCCRAPCRSSGCTSRRTSRPSSRPTSLCRSRTSGVSTSFARGTSTVRTLGVSTRRAGGRTISRTPGTCALATIVLNGLFAIRSHHILTVFFPAPFTHPGKIVPAPTHLHPRPGLNRHFQPKACAGRGRILDPRPRRPHRLIFALPSDGSDSHHRLPRLRRNPGRAIHANHIGSKRIQFNAFIAPNNSMF